MKLTQGHIWKQGDTYIRIVQLERLTVGYKTMSSPESKTGTHHQVTKKEFCRLLKSATPVPTEPATLAPREPQRRSIRGASGSPASS